LLLVFICILGLAHIFFIINTALCVFSTQRRLISNLFSLYSTWYLDHGGVYTVVSGADPHRSTRLVLGIPNLDFVFPLAPFQFLGFLSLLHGAASMSDLSVFSRNVNVHLPSADPPVHANDSSTLVSQCDDRHHSLKPEKRRHKCDHYGKFDQKIDLCYVLHGRPPRFAVVAHIDPPPQPSSADPHSSVSATDKSALFNEFLKWSSQME